MKKHHATVSVRRSEITTACSEIRQPSTGKRIRTRKNATTTIRALDSMGTFSVAFSICATEDLKKEKGEQDRHDQTRACPVLHGGKPLDYSY
jgi:hypothetical protein